VIGFDSILKPKAKLKSKLVAVVADLFVALRWVLGGFLRRAVMGAVLA
jgi:hypothetical protein